MSTPSIFRTRLRPKNHRIFRSGLFQWLAHCLEPRRIGTLALPASMVLATPLVSRAAEAQTKPPRHDDWSLQSRPEPAKSIHQQLRFLQRHPFDQSRWKQLFRQHSSKRIREVIDHAIVQPSPSTAWIILSARLEMDENNPQLAARRLQELRQDKAIPSSWRSRAFDLFCDALEQSGQIDLLINELEQAALANARNKQGHRYLLQAFQLSEQRDNATSVHTRQTLGLAKALAKHSPKQINAHLRLARAAARAQEWETADTAFQKANELTSSSTQRFRQSLERAQVRQQSGRPVECASLLWSELIPQLDQPKKDREQSWDLLLRCSDSNDASLAHLRQRLQTHLQQKEHQGEAEAWKLLAKAHSISGLDASPYWQRAFDEDPRDSDSQQALVRSFEAQGARDKAFAVFEASPPKNPQQIQIALSFASRMLTAGETVRSFQFVRSIEERIATEKSPHQRDSLFQILDFYNQHGERRRGLGVLQSLTESAPRDPDVRIALGEQHFQMGNKTEALQEWQRLPQLIRPKSEGWKRYAETLLAYYREDHSLGPAIAEALAQALKKSPDEIEVFRLQAIFDEERKRNDKSLTAWNKVRMAALQRQDQALIEESRSRLVELLANHGAPRRPASQSALILLLKRQFANDKANELLAKDSGLLLAELYSREGQYSSSALIFRELIARFPSEARYQVGLAQALGRGGKNQASIQIWQELASSNTPQRLDALAKLSDLAFERGDRDSAIRHAEQARKINPQMGGDLLTTLAKKLLEHGELNRAEKIYRQLATEESNSPQSSRHGIEAASIALSNIRLTSDSEHEAWKRIYDFLSDPMVSDQGIREISSNALEIAELTHRLHDLLDISLLRIRRHPDREEIQELFLSVLERMSIAQLENWALSKGSSHVQLLHDPLQRLLMHATIRTRARVAALLDKVRIPNAAEQLLQMGQKLTPPREATGATRRSYELARTKALWGASLYPETASVDQFIELLKNSQQEDDTRLHLLWFLIKSSDPKSRNALLEFLSRPRRPRSTALACLGLARHSVSSTNKKPLSSRSSHGVDIGARLLQLTKGARDTTVHRICSFAALTWQSPQNVPNQQPENIDATSQALQAPDPVIQALQVWRMTRFKKVSKNTTHQELAELLNIFLIADELPMKAAAANLHAMLSGTPGPDWQLPENAPGKRWRPELERWLLGQIAPPIQPLSEEYFRTWRESFESATKSHSKVTATRVEQQRRNQQMDRRMSLLFPNFKSWEK